MGLEDNGMISSPAVRPVGTPGPPVHHLPTNSAYATSVAPSDNRAHGGDPIKDESTKKKGAAAGGEGSEAGKEDEKDKGATATASAAANAAPAMPPAKAPASGPAAASPASTDLAFLPFQVRE